MSRSVFVLGVLVALSGCTPPSQRMKSSDLPGRWSPAEVSHVRVQMQSLGEVSNNGLQLPTVSPNGQWIAFSSHMGGGNNELYALHVESGQLIRLTETDPPEFVPSWQPASP